MTAMLNALHAFLAGQASRHCTACGPAVVEAFQSQGLPYLMDVLQVCAPTL